MNSPLLSLRLKHNPFEPSASGVPVSGELWVPDRWRQPLENFLDTMQHTDGAKAYAILGEYGSGKSYLLHWLEREALPSRRIQPFLFDNPGAQFYDLANSLLRKIGREEFAKSLWELLTPQLPGFQPSLFGASFQEWLRAIKKHRQQEEAIRVLADKIREKQIASDEEVRYKLGRLVVETYDRPYFQYKDFVAGRQTSLVAEGEEAPYFAAVLRALRLTGSASAVGFLLDEFEEISLQKRLNKRQAHEYLATMKRLIGLTEREPFWIIVAMTPLAAEVTEKLEPALWQRFVSQGERKFQIPPLDEAEARVLILNRLKDARSSENDSTADEMFPFPEDVVDYLREDIKSSPRRLVKVCSIAIAQAAQTPPDQIELPFGSDYLRRVQDELYPLDLPERGNEQ